MNMQRLVSDIFPGFDVETYSAMPGEVAIRMHWKPAPQNFATWHPTPRPDGWFILASDPALRDDIMEAIESTFGSGAVAPECRITEWDRGIFGLFVAIPQPPSDN